MSRLHHEAWRRFVTASAAAAAALVLFAVWVGFRVGGATATTVVDDLALAAFQFAAAASCFLAVTRMSARYKLPWTLLGAAAASVGVGQVIWAFEEIVLGMIAPFPSAADVGNLIALPLSAAAGLSFPSAPGRTTTRSRALVYGAIIAITLLLLSWVFGLADIYGAASGSVIGQAIGVTYLCGQAIVLTVLIQALGRARRSQRVRLVLVTFAMLVNIASITVFASLAPANRFGPSDRLIDVGFAFVYLMIALAPLWPGADSEPVAEEGPSVAGAVLLPLVGATAAVVAILGLRLLHGPIQSPIPSLLVAGLIVFLTLSQMLTYSDSLQLLLASRSAERRLRDHTALLDQVISHTPAGLARVGLDLHIIDANPRLCSLLRANSEILAGMPLARYFPHTDLTSAIRQVNVKGRTFDEHRKDTAEVDSKVARADSSGVWMHWSVTAVRNSAGDVDYFLVMCEDTQAQHDAEVAAIANLAGLEKLNRLKSEFISVVSHEFRTALTGIQGFGEMLRDNDLPPSDVKQFASDIFEDAVRLNRLISDILDLDRMEAGRMTSHIEPVDLNRVATDAVERARITTTRHSVRMELDPMVDVVSGDRDRLFQVVSNLLSNAIKYSPKGGEVFLTTRVDGDAVHVIVKDQGQGIPPEFMDRLFERYERYENALAGTIVGTGLGLVIARRIVESHGGRIWAKSKVGSGSEFHFTIPLHGTPATATNPPVSRTAPAQDSLIPVGTL
jgi:PAS domain S-box-containing protein